VQVYIRNATNLIMIIVWICCYCCEMYRTTWTPTVF